MKNFLLEACVDSVESAIAAADGGADRLELCSNLIIGGTTPGRGLFERVSVLSRLPVNVLIRPRYGDFCYTEYEYEMIKDEISMYRELGANGVVIGFLKPDGNLDVNRMQEAMVLAGGMSVTLHRAFDMCRNPFDTLNEAKQLGVHTILTSGQQNSCLEGKALLRKLVTESRNEIDILVGGGVKPGILKELYEATGAVSYHMSGKVTIDSDMLYRSEEVTMGAPGFDEYVLWRTDAQKIKAAKEILRDL